jgi:hypothetical protein
MLTIFVGCGSSDKKVSNGDLSVKINSAKTRVLEGKTITLEAAVSGNAHAVSYLWQDNGTTLGSESKIKSNFPLGEHNISLKVQDGSKTATDTKKITVSDYFVDINKGKTNYGITENTTLEASIEGSVTVDTYAWKEGDTVLSTTSKLDKKFSVGHHIVVLEVVANNHTQTATFEFDILGSNFITKKLGHREDEVMLDTTYKLMWVNDKNESKKACLAVHEANLTLAQSLSQNFCKNIEFGEFPKGSWRAPTPAELSNFIKQTYAADILPAYYMECNLLFADENGTSKVVATRYGVREDIDGSVVNVSAKLGEIINYRTHYGIRCVRDIP